MWQSKGILRGLCGALAIGLLASSGAARANDLKDDPRNIVGAGYNHIIDHVVRVQNDQKGEQPRDNSALDAIVGDGNIVRYMNMLHNIDVNIHKASKTNNPRDLAFYKTARSGVVVGSGIGNPENEEDRKSLSDFTKRAKNRIKALENKEKASSGKIGKRSKKRS